MKTEDLVGLLAANSMPVRLGVAKRRFGVSLPLAAVSATLLMMVVFGIRPDFSIVARTALFWAKLAFPLFVAAGALITTLRLARPGAAIGSGWFIMALAVFVVWVAGVFVVAASAPADR